MRLIINFLTGYALSQAPQGYAPYTQAPQGYAPYPPAPYQQAPHQWLQGIVTIWLLLVSSIILVQIVVT